MSTGARGWGCTGGRAGGGKFGAPGGGVWAVGGDRPGEPFMMQRPPGKRPAMKPIIMGIHMEPEPW